MQQPHTPEHPPCIGLECEDRTCAEPATTPVDSEDHGIMYFCATHAQQRTAATLPELHE